MRHRELGLTDAEYELILERLAREPGPTELAMLSLMWSEHCAYKHSRKLLRRLPTEGPAVLMGPGENAGVVDVGEGLGVAFKVESHNHPSAVEPFQGAATGVGGILRDVFAVGARPIAVLDSLRFGEPATSERSRYLLEHAVAGIGHYGNSIGVPTVGGEIYFENSYDQNCLINAMCLGLAPHERLIRSAAAGPGNVLVLLGALTGRDGIGGASVLASAELSEEDAAKRPSVQIGDPFAEKKLLECCLELLDRELLVSLQDLGAAGLTSSASEMASKGGVGLDIDVAKVPLREPGLEPFEIMVSESQERMLCVVEPDRLDEVTAVCEHWETLATAIGVVNDSGRLRVLAGGTVTADLPVGILVDDCPLYDLEPVARPSDRCTTRRPPCWTASRRPPRRCSRCWGRRTSPPGGPYSSSTTRSCSRGPCAGPSRPTRPCWRSRVARAIAVSIDGNGRRVACDPRLGAAEAVFECAANLACTGATPLGLTNCLNFGNPEKPHVAWQLVGAVEGITMACEALGIPVVGGNVSLYNEAPAGPILPTPVIGMVGRLPDASRAGRLGFAQAGDLIALVGPFEPSAVGSELSKLEGEQPAGELPPMDMQAVRDAHDAVRHGVNSGALHNAHDIAEGGLSVALAECCIAGRLGARVRVPEEVDPFAEAPGRAFVVSGTEEALAGLTIIGQVGGDHLTLEGHLDLAVSELHDVWERGLVGYV